MALRSITMDGLVMQEQRARKILQALVQGVDPTTGAELEAGTVLRRADVLRALLAGVTALEQVSRIGKINAIPWMFIDRIRECKAITRGRANLAGRREARSEMLP
jgi:hypothetical protein